MRMPMPTRTCTLETRHCARARVGMGVGVCMCMCILVVVVVRARRVTELPALPVALHVLVAVRRRIGIVDEMRHTGQWQWGGGGAFRGIARGPPHGHWQSRMVAVCVPLAVAVLHVDGHATIAAMAVRQLYMAMRVLPRTKATTTVAGAATVAPVAAAAAVVVAAGVWSVAVAAVRTAPLELLPPVAVVAHVGVEAATGAATHPVGHQWQWHQLPVVVGVAHVTAVTRGATTWSRSRVTPLVALAAVTTPAAAVTTVAGGRRRSASLGATDDSATACHCQYWHVTWSLAVPVGLPWQSEGHWHWRGHRGGGKQDLPTSSCCTTCTVLLCTHARTYARTVTMSRTPTHMPHTCYVQYAHTCMLQVLAHDDLARLVHGAVHHAGHREHPP